MSSVFDKRNIGVHVHRKATLVHMPIHPLDICPWAKHWPNFIKIGQSHDFDYFWDRGQGALKITLDAQKMILRQKWMPFLKSAPSKTPGYQISSKSDNFSFRSFFGGPTPKKPKFFLVKNVRIKILTLYSYSAHSKTTHYQLTATLDDN